MTGYEKNLRGEITSLTGTAPDLMAARTPETYEKNKHEPAC